VSLAHFLYTAGLRTLRHLAVRRSRRRRRQR